MLHSRKAYFTHLKMRKTQIRESEKHIERKYLVWMATLLAVSQMGCFYSFKESEYDEGKAVRIAMRWT